MLKKISVLLIILSTNFGCKKEVANTTETLCENEKYLLAPDSTKFLLDLDLNINTDEHIKTLKDTFNFKDLCDKPISFNNKFKDRFIELNLFAICDLIVHPHSPIITIELFIENQILYNGDSSRITTLDSIQNIIKKDLPFEKNYINRITIESPYGLSKPIIKDVIYEISEAYLKILKAISLEKYEIELCELKHKQIIDLRKEYSLTIELESFSQNIQRNFQWQQLMESNYED